jgi:RNA-directed DNA polymerase
MPSKSTAELYSIEQSPLYRIGRQKDLVPLFGQDLKTLRRLARDRYHHYWRKDLMIGEKLRSIVCPFGTMRKLHERIQAISNRIKQPAYLHSPRRGHTAAGNADLHRFSKTIAKLDIRQFYPSTTSEHVYRFFRYRMEMCDDVAGLMTHLCTVDGKLPFGSPLSPILCTLVHRDLFDHIAQHCQFNGLIMSLWVDDITLSGETIRPSVMWTIKGIIHAKGLKYHKVQIRERLSGAIVTGHYIHRGGIAAANKHHLGVRDSLAELDSVTGTADRLKLIRSLIGKTNHGRAIYIAGTAVRVRLDSRRDWLHTERRSLERERFIRPAAHPIIPQAADDMSLPWESQVHADYLAALSVMHVEASSNDDANASPAALPIEGPLVEED